MKVIFLSFQSSMLSWYWSVLCLDNREIIKHRRP